MNASELFQIGVSILRTTLTEAKTIVAQIGDVKTSTVEASNIPFWQHVGFMSRPSKAEKGKQAAEGISLRIGHREIIIASRDPRGMELAATLEDGETCVYAPGETGTGQARTLYKADGSIHHYTRKGNTPGGTGMTVQLDATTGAIRIIASSGAALILDDDGARLLGPGGAAGLTLASSGNATLVGTGQAQVDGGTVMIGSAAVPLVNAALKGPTGLTATPSLKVLIE